MLIQIFYVPRLGACISRLFPDSKDGPRDLNTWEPLSRGWMGRAVGPGPGLGKRGAGKRVNCSPGFRDAEPVPLSCLGRNEPLKKERLKWKSDYPMTDGQLRSKRDEFWDTAPAFEGRKEIWDALKAAAYAAEANDHELAQAILDGASITLPHGKQAGWGCIPAGPRGPSAPFRVEEGWWTATPGVATKLLGGGCGCSLVHPAALLSMDQD